ncbi:hypothetical protein AOXY_G19113 [Acipenser oxyrinchus oxyrinchus]|uniref:Uncharacterized protein n=1 Tax=Acipenser oxyrinchus oxyrinchus TaxID=40147 RepID=A0AAD8D2X9_ACIOX|nr:hypothetical protein AOXY_G19113 [Acipenser oxyrinchus oxyrinchus]
MALYPPQTKIQIIINKYIGAGHSTTSSQPMMGLLPAGNITLSASILLAGAIPSKVLRVLNFMNISTISTSTFFQHQKQYLQTTVAKSWIHHQQATIEQLKSNRVPMVVGGDGRCDSPGYSVKNMGTYVHITVDYAVFYLYSNKTASSYHMELEGLKHSLSQLMTWRISISAPVTDRHIQSFLQSLPVKRFRHYFDVWHVAKGMQINKGSFRCLHCLHRARRKRSIINQIYWIAESSNVNADMIHDKWRGIINHVQNVHTGHGKYFTTCAHPPKPL